jgi:HSP20 family protein
MDIVETPEEIRLIADMPGVTPDDLDIEFEQDQLNIRGRVEPRQAEGKTRWLLREYGVGSFQRSVGTGRGLDTGRITAELKDGVLTVHLPKSEEMKPRQIKVQG